MKLNYKKKFIFSFVFIIAIVISFSIGTVFRATENALHKNRSPRFQEYPWMLWYPSGGRLILDLTEHLANNINLSIVGFFSPGQPVHVEVMVSNCSDFSFEFGDSFWRLERYDDAVWTVVPAALISREHHQWSWPETDMIHFFDIGRYGMPNPESLYRIALDMYLDIEGPLGIMRFSHTFYVKFYGQELIDVMHEHDPWERIRLRLHPRKWSSCVFDAINT